MTPRAQPAQTRLRRLHRDDLQGSIALMRRLGMTQLGSEETDVVEEAFILPRPAEN